MLDGLQEFWNERLPFPLENAIDRSCAMLQELLRNKRGAMAADEHKTLRQCVFREFGQIDNFRHVRQIIAGEGHDIGPPGMKERRIIPMSLDLQINEAYRVSGLADGLSHKL